MNKQSLNEDLKRFRLLMEYDFYVPESYEEIAGDGLLGEDDPADEEDSLGDAPVDDGEPDMDGDSFGDDSLGDEDVEVDINSDPAPEEPTDFSGDDINAAPMPEAPPVDDSVELDVTQLVQGTEQAKASADEANRQLNVLVQKFDELGLKLSQMDGITQKIDSLEHEIEKRNPTEQEKLEMRSLNSYPYNLKLTDYWAEKEGQYDVMNQNGTRQPKEYVLTQDDINNEYNQNAIKDSFDSNGYDEEDI